MDHFGALIWYGHAIEDVIALTVQLRISTEPFFRKRTVVSVGETDNRSKGSPGPLEKTTTNMNHIIMNLIPKLHKAPHPTLSHIEPIPDSEPFQRDQPLCRSPCHRPGTESRRSHRAFGQLRRPTGNRNMSTHETTSPSMVIRSYENFHQPSLRKVSRGRAETI